MCVIVLTDFNACGCVVINVNVRGCVVIDLNACGHVMMMFRYLFPIPHQAELNEKSIRKWLEQSTGVREKGSMNLQYVEAYNHGDNIILLDHL